jgi:hypothetical protein
MQMKVVHPVRAGLLISLAFMVLGGSPDVGNSAAAQQRRVVEDFESYEVGEPPPNWVLVRSRSEVVPPEEGLEPGEDFFIVEEQGNKFVRFENRNEATRFSQRNGYEFEWNLQTHPRLQWQWRALKLPEGASEKGQNDTGAALYVTFGTDWLGRPKSIKYSYSSSLPVGTVVSFGPLKVIVADSAVEPRLGEWKTQQRNIVSDYRQVFGGSPPNEPVSITLWSDSDTTGDTAKVDFDDIVLLPPYRR